MLNVQSSMRLVNNVRTMTKFQYLWVHGKSTWILWQKGKKKEEKWKMRQGSQPKQNDIKRKSDLKKLMKEKWSYEKKEKILIPNWKWNSRNENKKERESENGKHKENCHW